MNFRQLISGLRQLISGLRQLISGLRQLISGLRQLINVLTRRPGKSTMFDDRRDAPFVTVKHTRAIWGKSRDCNDLLTQLDSSDFQAPLRNHTRNSDKTMDHCKSCSSLMPIQVPVPGTL